MTLSPVKGQRDRVLASGKNPTPAPSKKSLQLVIHACLGWTFEFRRKKLVGSYLFLRVTKREWLLPKTASAAPLPT